MRCELVVDMRLGEANRVKLSQRQVLRQDDTIANVDAVTLDEAKRHMIVQDGNFHQGRINIAARRKVKNVRLERVG